MLDNKLIEKLKKIKALAMDVDGTLTDSAMYYSENGEELKRFSTRDGMGITLLKKGGIKTILITSENSIIAKKRAEKLQIDTIILGTKNKSQDLLNYSQTNDISLEEIAYIGDDINDEHVIKICGFSSCPNDAVDSIKEIVDYISKFNGGNGAVRDVCELILTAQNKSIKLTENW